MKTLGTYSEDGWIATVQILTNTSNTKWERYRLKVIHTLREPPRFFKTPPDGQVFTVVQRVGIGAWGGMWTLDVLPNDRTERPGP